MVLGKKALENLDECWNEFRKQTFIKMMPDKIIKNDNKVTNQIKRLRKENISPKQ